LLLEFTIFCKQNIIIEGFFLLSLLQKFIELIIKGHLSQPHFGLSVRIKFTLPKSGNLESSETPKNLELDFRGQSTSHWGFFFILLESSWNVDVQNGLAWAIWTSAAQVMGKRRGKSQTGTKSQESTRSRRLQKECDIMLESSQRELQDWFRPHPNQRSEQEVMDAQSLRSPTRDSFGTPLWESREKEPFGCGCHRVTQRILYGGRWWLPPNSGRGESSESKVACGLSQHQKGAEWVVTNLWLVLDAGPCNKIIVPLPSLISRLVARPSYPL